MPTSPNPDHREALRRELIDLLARGLLREWEAQQTGSAALEVPAEIGLTGPVSPPTPWSTELRRTR